jgi:hypothetical protein
MVVLSNLKLHKIEFRTNRNKSYNLEDLKYQFLDSS